MDAEVYSESLAYQQVKKRAVSSRSFRVKIPSSNGSNFLPGQTVNIDLPSNLSAQYYNFNQLYLQFTLTTGAEVAVLDRNGAYNLIKRLTIQSAGSMLCDIINYNVLVSAFLDMQASHEWKSSTGNLLAGMYGDALRGESIAATTSRVFCLPLPLNILASTTPHRLIPAFSLSNLQLRFQLATAAEAFVSATGIAYGISNVECVCMMTQLSPQAQSEIDKATNGVYNILCLNYMNAQTSQAAAQSTLTTNLGFAMSSLERIIVIHRKADAANGTSTVYSNSRIKNGLSEYSFLINSEQYPARPINVIAQGSEVWAETLISDHRLMDFNRGCGVNVGLAAVGAAAAGNVGVGVSDLTGSAPNIAKTLSYSLSNADATGASAGAVALNTAATASNIGTFIASCDFESGLSDGKSSTIYSGISTIASTVQYKGIYSGEAPVAAQIDFFACYTVLLSLDMRGLGIFQMRV